jgi:CHRD domain
MARRTGVVVTFLVVGLVAVGALASFAVAQSGNRFNAGRMLDQFEVPVVSAPGARGSFEARLEGSTVHYKLTYSGLNFPVTQAHIHLGQRTASGGISVFLCGTTGFMGPPGTPAMPICPAGTSGTVEDSFVAADVIGPGVQGIAAGEFTELLAQMREGNTYANVHSTVITGGEIRGQIRGGGGGDDDDDDDDDD